MPKAPRNFSILLFILAAFLPAPVAWSQETNAAPVVAASSVNDDMTKGADFASHGDLDGAIAAFTAAINAAPTYAVAYTKRGMALALQHKFTEALADFDKAIQIDPKEQEAYYQRGSVKGEKGDFDGALADFDRAVELAPGYAMALYNRGHVKYFKGDLKGSLDDLNQAITLNPKHAPSYWMRGVIELAQPDHPAAIADFKESLKDGFAYGAFWLWIVQTEDGDGAIARNNLATAAANTDMFKPDDWPTYLVNYILGKLPEDQLMARAKAGGDDAQAHLCEACFYSGMAHHFLGDAKAAKDAFQQAIDTGAIQSEEWVEAKRQMALLQTE